MSLSDGIADSEFGINRLLVFKVGHEAQLYEDEADMISRSRINASGYDDLTLGGAEFEKLKSLRILGETLDSKLTFETHMREVMSKAARSLGIVSLAGKLSTCAQELPQCICFVQPGVSCPRVDIVCEVSFAFPK